MHQFKISKHNSATSSCIYQIKVRGWLGNHWKEWFDGMSITNESETDGPPVSILTGPVIDQAALFGLLIKIHNLGLTLLSVNYVHLQNNESAGELQNEK